MFSAGQWSNIIRWWAFYGLLAICVFTAETGLAQGTSNLRYAVLPLQGDTLTLDSLSLVPGTLKLWTANGGVLDTADYELRAFESKLIWKKKPAADSIKFSYRVYPFKLGGETYHKSFARYQEYSANSVARPFLYNPEEEKTKLIDFGNLDFNGSFSRSLSFGSNQDVVLNSLFNLQLSGMLTRDLEVTAAITDNNIPIQPEGNTQQIQEFDKIFIQLRKDQHKVIVGDYDLFNPANEYFMKFSKKYQGGYYSSYFDIKKAGRIYTGVAGGISKGKFARNTLAVTEGNQGPYKLVGAAGETFIVILANSEEVFINGQKMERGANRDYVIDYNLGEIRFMPRRIITKDLRVTVEFEYSERSYLRTAAFVNTGFQTKKADIHFSLYSEQDSKNQNVQQSLDGPKKAFLQNLGDSIQNAFYPGVDSVAYDVNRILYAMVDSLGFDSVFVYSTDPTKAKYALSFALVGQGNGDYIPASSNANGRVYQWVQPIINASDSTLIHQGTYKPVIFLVTPKYQQMYTLGGQYQINATNVVNADLALSNTDLNMFSKKDNADNVGVAARAAYKGSILTKSDTANNKQQRVNLDISYEFNQNRFNTIERYRNIEFNRDWNISTTTKRYNEHLAIANIGYEWTGLGLINYRFKTFIQDTVYRGFENGLNGNFSKNGFNFVFANSYLNATSTTNHSNFIRPKADFWYAGKKTKGWRIGTLFDHEVNRIQNKGADTLTANSYLWQNYKVYVVSPDSIKNKYSIEFTMRYEHRPKGSGFDAPYFRAQTLSFNGTLASVKNQTLNYNLTYRHSKNADSLNSNQPEHFYLGRIDYNFSVLRGAIRSTTLYELGTGREQKTQVAYQASPTNQGDYVWKDANGNGIKELNEFVISQFKEDTSYVRVFVVTPEYVTVNTNQFNQVLNIDPAAVWKNKTGAKKILAMFNLFVSVQISKKTYAVRSKNVGSYFNPFPFQKDNDQLVATTISSRNTLYFNRMEAKYGAQVDFNYTQTRTLLTTGFENRTLQSQGLLIRWNIVKALNTQWTYTNGTKSNQSDFYTYLKYKFGYNDASANISYQFKAAFRLSLKYDFSFKVNPTDTVGKQTAQVNRLTLEARYNRLSKTTVNATLSYASIAYRDKGYANQQLEYAMLEGLRNGNNLVWTVGLEQNLTANIQLSISYDGRMTGFEKGVKESMKPVHTGRAEIRALF